MFTSQIIVIALVQGITEFLPISSSAHLILVPWVTDWPDQGPTIDVAAHVGTLLAVLVYFWRDIGAMIGGLLGAARGRRTPPGARLFLCLIIASLPVVAAGLLVHRLAGDALRSIEIIAWTTLLFGMLLWLADRYSVTLRRSEHLTWTDALLIGLAQILSLLPGTSRSGITMTMARFLGFERVEAARFSMLLSIPVIAGAGTLAALDLLEGGDPTVTLDAALVALLSFLSALAAIAGLMAWVARAGFGIFALYRIVLGGILLYLVYGVGG